MTNWTRMAEGGGRMYIGTLSRRITDSQASRMKAANRIGVARPARRARICAAERLGSRVRAMALEEAVAKEDLLDVTDKLLEGGTLTHGQRARTGQVDLHPAHD